MSPRLHTLAFEGIYRDSCGPPPGRGDIRPTLGTEKSLYVSSGTAAPPRSSHRGSLFSPAWTEPRAPQCPQLVAAGPWPAWPGPHRLFTKPGLQAEVARSLIGSFSVHLPHPIGPAGGRPSVRNPTVVPFWTLLGLCSPGAETVPVGLFEPQPGRWVTLP